MRLTTRQDRVENRDKVYLNNLTVLHLVSEEAVVAPYWPSFV